MNVRWRKLLLKTSFWIATEILLNLIGIDDLADYSEFVFENRDFGAKIGCISGIGSMV